MPYPYSGIGKDWNHWGDVLPDDREAWEWIAEEETRPVQAWERQWTTIEYPRPNAVSVAWTFPDPHVLYTAYEFDAWDADSARAEIPKEAELHRAYLHALRRVTEPDEWVYAFAAPDESWTYGYRFWPHRGKVHAYWYASPIANGDDQYFLAQDFSWGVLAFCLDSESETQSCAFGQAIIDAFDADPPPGWRDSSTQ